MEQEHYRILYIQPVVGGGSDVSLFELVRGLNKAKYAPVVLFYTKSPYQDLYEASGAKIIILSENLPTALLKQPTLERQKDNAERSFTFIAKVHKFIKQDVLLAKHIARIIRSEKIDLVHHNLSLDSSRAGVLAASISRIPQICHFRLFNNITLLGRYLIPFVNKFIFISKAISEHYYRQGIPLSRGHIIYNPITEEEFWEVSDADKLRTELNLTGYENIISNVGRIDWWKGQDYFLKAMANVVKTFPNTKILIVGELSPTTQRNQLYWLQLQQMVIDLNLSDHVVFTGSRRDIPQIMKISDIVVHSASKPEPWGRVVAEAMMAGRPVIATNAGGIMDSVTNGFTGKLVSLQDTSAMAEAICELLTDQALARRLGQQAQQFAREHFSVKKHVNAVQDIYHEILSKKTGYLKNKTRTIRS